MKILSVFLVLLPNVLSFGFFGGYVQLFYRWRDGTVSAFPPKNGCNFYQGCYPEYQRLPNGWPLFDKPMSPNIVFREPAFRPWTKIDSILFPVHPVPPSTTTAKSTTEVLPEIPVRNLIPDFLTTKPEEENIIKDSRKGPPTTPPPIYRPSPVSKDQGASTPRFTPPPPILRKPTTKKEPTGNNIDEEELTKKYTTPHPIQRPTRPSKAADEGLLQAAGGNIAKFMTTTSRPLKTTGGKPNLISWEQNRFPVPRTTRRPRRRTTKVPETTTQIDDVDGGQILIETWTKKHDHTSPKPIHDRSKKVPATGTEPSTQTKVPKEGRIFIENWTKTHVPTSPKPIIDQSP